MRAVCNFESALWAFLSVVTWKLGIHSLALVRLETLKWFFLLCCCFFSFFFQMTSFLQWRWMKVFSFAFKLSFSLPPLSLISESFLSIHTILLQLIRLFIVCLLRVLTSTYALCLSPVDIRMSKPIEVENPAADSPMENTGGMLMRVCMCEWESAVCLDISCLFFSLSLSTCVSVLDSERNGSDSNNQVGLDFKITIISDDRVFSISAKPVSFQ